MRTYNVKQLFLGKKIGFDDSCYVTKCLQQIEMTDLLHMCAQLDDQPSNIKNHGGLGTHGENDESSGHQCPES